ncbi:hypothetical protein LTS18_013901, partial [Coniosporium uncinatum]
MGALKEGGSGDHAGSLPPGNMQRALIFQAILAMIAIPFPLALGIQRLGLGGGRVKRRIVVESHGGDLAANVEDENHPNY